MDQVSGKAFVKERFDVSECIENVIKTSLHTVSRLQVFTRNSKVS